MAAELLLHAKKEDFLNLIEQLDGKMNQLKGTLSSYQTLKNDVSMFMDGNVESCYFSKDGSWLSW